MGVDLASQKSSAVARGAGDSGIWMILSRGIGGSHSCTIVVIESEEGDVQELRTEKVPQLVLKSRGRGSTHGRGTGHHFCNVTG